MKNHRDRLPGKSMGYKVLFLLLMGTCYYGGSHAQVKIGNNPHQIGKASLLELESDARGLLLPRLPDTIAINASNPASGMLIYLEKTPNTGLYVRKSGAWTLLSGGSNNGASLLDIINNATQTALNLKASTANLDLKSPIASPSFTGTVNGITSAMVGLGSVDNTSDAAKPISIATLAALNTKLSAADLALKAPLASPAFTGVVSGITSAMVGLGAVDNTSDAIKPISAATQIALGLKADISALGAKANQSAVDLKAPLASPSFTGTVSGISSSMIGLGNADNTSDAAKPISTATQSALNTKAGTSDLLLKAPLASPSFTGTVSGISSAMIGLGNADNTSDAAKPISIATQAALDLKAGVAALAAKADQSSLDLKAPLASPTFTGTVSGITPAMLGLANVNNTTDLLKPISAATQTALDLKAGITDLNLKAPLASPAFTGTVTGITAAMVGLGNVDNTSDINKPVSAAVAASLALKAPLASPVFTGTVSGITSAMVGLSNVNNTTDLLKPISIATQTALDGKAGVSELAAKADQTAVDLKAPLASPAFTGTVTGITSAMVGLGNADNTTDAAKPVSTATQAALDLKADLASPSLTGVPMAPTAVPGTNTTQIATTAFVMANLNGYSSVNAGTEISTVSSTDEVATGMTLTPGAGTYSVMFNGQYESSSAGVTGQGVTGLAAAYSQINGYATTSTHPLVFGSGETITPGVYSVAGAGSIAGNLTLDAGGNANAIFIFKIDGAFTTGAGTTIILTGQANAANIFWITTPSYAIGLGAATIMKGTLIANGGAISMGAGGTLEGRLLTTAGAVGFGPGSAVLPAGTSVINLGGVANFALFTSSGAVGNTGISTITGNIGTNNGAITGFETSTVNGSFFTPVINGDALATFSVFHNGVLIANSGRTRVSTANTVDVSLHAIATVLAGQAVDIRWKTSVGVLKLGSRILTLTRVQ